MSRILPPSSTPLERTVANVGAGIERIPVPLRDLWDPWSIPASLLPYLAWSLSIEEEWNFAETEEEQRALVAAAVELHRYKGTPHAIRYGLRSLGFEDAEIVEGEPVLRHDGTVRRDGIENYNAGRRWALFSVVLDLGDTKGFSGEIAQRVRTVLSTWKNARSHLHRIQIRASIHDGRSTTPATALWLRVGLQSISTRAPVRNGTQRRATPTRYIRDGYWSFDGTMPRNKSVSWSGLHFGPGRLQARLRASLHLQERRAPNIPRDGSIRFDSAYSRDFSGAIDPRPLMHDVSVSDARGAWPAIPGFLIYEDPDAWGRGDAIDGPLYGRTVRKHSRDGSFVRDGSRLFGPEEQAYYTQQGETVLQTVWDYGTTQWDGNVTRWDQ